jgi:hypothetical protein
MTNVSRIPTPKSLYDQWIKGQGLTEADIAVMGLRLIQASEAAPILGFNPNTPCVLIPYGSTDYFRVRRLGVTADKYLSAKGSGCAPPYLSPGLPWEDIKADNSSSVVITEGEVKSFWGCKTGGLVVGIGGTDMQALLFDGSWEWRGRNVSVCFDHDAGQEPGQYKPGVANALGRLCSRLIEAGAVATVLHLGQVAPHPEDKLGLDDYLRGGGDWAGLLGTASPAPEWCSQLAGLLESCVYVVGTNHTHVYNLENRSRKSPTDFHDTHIEKKRLVQNQDGKSQSKPISRIWIEHPGRVTVSDYTLDPKLPFGVRGGRMNLWEGYPVFKLGTADKTARVQAEWQRFMEGLFGEHWRWVGLWTGHMLNRPWERCTQAVMLVTMVQGIGKSLYGDVVRDLTGRHGLECSASRMFGGFNSDMEAKTFVMVNELDVKFSAKEGQLNDLLTEEVVKIEQKGKDVIELPNLRRWYMTTNTSSPCRLSRGQRRILVINPPRVVGDTRGEWGLWVGGVLAKFRRDSESLAAIRLWFDELWYGEGNGGEGVWDATLPVPHTQEADDLAEASMTTNQILAADMLEYIRASDGGWGAAHPNTRKGNVKAFGDLTALVKAHGGFVGQKVVRDNGVLYAYTIYDLTGLVGRALKPATGGYNMEVDVGETKVRGAELAKLVAGLKEILEK